MNVTTRVPHPLGTTSKGPEAPYRMPRRDVLRGVTLLMAGGMLSGPIASLAGCAPTGLTQRATNPPRMMLRRITPENASTITHIAALQPADGLLRGVACSPDARIIATGGRTHIQLWDAETATSRKLLSGHTDQIFALAWSPANELLASASFDGTVRIWDAQRSQAVHTLDCGATTSVFSVAWSPNGQQIACGLRDGRVFVWEVATATRQATLTGPTGRSQGGRYPFAAWGVAWAPDEGHLVSTRYDDLLLVWDLSSGASTLIPKTDTQPNTIAWAPQGELFALTDDAGKVILCNGVNGQREATFTSHPEAGWSYGLAWSPDGAMVASGRELGVIEVWDAHSGRELASLQGHTDAVWGLAWSSDGERLLSASDDGSARIWGVVIPS